MLPHSSGLQGIFAGNQSALGWADEEGVMRRGRSVSSGTVSFMSFCRIIVILRQK